MANDINDSTTRARLRPPFEPIALVLRGSAALGPHQAGVYESLTEAGVQPGWIAIRQLITGPAMADDNRTLGIRLRFHADAEGRRHLRLSQ
jgi:hypothetical protein